MESVCDTRGDLGLDALDGMASMVDMSLVQHVDRQRKTRFTLLSTIREYALEHLALSADERAGRAGAHAAYYLVLAEEGAQEVPPTPNGSTVFEVEHDNFRAALDYLIKTRDVEWGLRLGAALFRFWETREYFTEGRDAIDRLLALETSEPVPNSVRV